MDQQTGTIRIAGAFPNPGNILRPGQYGRVRAVRQGQKGALLVPQRAVTELQGSDEVAVVGPGNKITIRTVQTGERVDTMWIINKGLNAGDRVVAASLMLMALYSPKGTYDAQFLANYGYINLVDPVIRVPRIASVGVFGAGQYAM